MRNLIVFLVLLLSVNLSAQDCEINISGNVPACPGDLLILSVIDADSLSYEWSPGGEETAAITITPEVSTLYGVRIYNDNYECNVDTLIEVYPPVSVEFDQTQLTCQGSENCQAKVTAIGLAAYEPDEYIYEWNVSPINILPDPSKVVGLCGNQTYGIRVTDPNGCYRDTTYKVKSFLSPVIDMSFDPDTTTYAYLQKPRVQFFYENLSIDTLAVTNHFWDFGDSVTSSADSPEHIFDRADDFLISLNVTDGHGCDTTYTEIYTIKPVDLFIPNVFTPNGDGTNDLFEFYTRDERGDPDYQERVDLTDYYISNEIVIFNRYGRKVYKANDYKNDWDGSNLPEGVYYFVLKCDGLYRDDVFKGSVTILR